MEQENNLPDITFISDRLKKYYDEIAVVKSNRKAILKEFFGLSEDEITDEIELSLESMIGTYIAYSKDNSAEILDEIKEKRRNFKKYLHKLIKDDYQNTAEAKGNPLFLSKECASYEEIIQNGATLGGYDTIESLRNSRYETVKEWASDVNSDCHEFVYFKALRPLRRITAVITDIKYHCLIAILESSRSGDRTGQRLLIEAAYEAPIFNATKSTMDIKIGQNNDDIVAYESYKQGYIEVKTTIGTRKIEDSTAIAVMNEMRQTYADANALDSNDAWLLSCICSAITGEDISIGTITLSLKTLYTAYNSETTRFRKSEYRQILKRLENLAKYSHEISRFDPETKTFEKKILHFFDFSYDLPVKGDIYKDMDNLDNIDAIPDEDIDFSNCITRFRIGDTIKWAWQQERIMKVSEERFNSLPSNKAKAFLFYLEYKRIKAYPENDVFIPFNDIKNAIRFDKKVRFKTEIRSMLDVFKMNNKDEKKNKKYDKAKMIISYEFKMNGVAVKFKPFEEHEIRTYQLNKPTKSLEG